MASQQEGAISELLDIKSRLERNCNDLMEEKSSVMQSIGTIKERKVEVRKKKATERQKLYKLRMMLADVGKQVEMKAKYIQKANSDVIEHEQKIRDIMQIKEFEQGILKTVSQIESAVNFYSEDSLQMEIIKRTNRVRELRVEYTKVENEYKDLLRRIEEKKRERERARELEAERARQEEERLMAEELKRQELSAQNSMIDSRDSQLPFRDGVPPVDQSNGTLGPPKSYDKEEPDGNVVRNIKPASPRSKVSFSQLLEW